VATCGARFFCSEEAPFHPDSEWALQKSGESGTHGYILGKSVTSCNKTVFDIAIAGVAGVDSAHKVQLDAFVVPDLPPHAVSGDCHCPPYDLHTSLLNSNYKQIWLARLNASASRNLV
jgi:hypothetical protein